jgi:hypothetical protein
VFTCTAGDILEFNTNPGALAEQEAKLNAEYQIQGFGLLHYDAIGLGEKDLAFGREYLRAAQQEHGLNFVSTNAVDDASGELLFAPYRVVEKGGKKVGFLAVVSPERHVVAPVEEALAADGIRLLDPSESVRQYLPELSSKTDVVVLLAHTGIETAEFLAEDLDVDAVIVGHYPAILDDPKRRGDVVVAMAGSKSDRFGTLELTFDAAGKLMDAKGDAVRLLSQGPMDGEIHALFEDLDRAQKEMRREHQLANQRQREQKAQEDRIAAVVEHNGILGAESCKSCHVPQFEAWSQTPHATAFATLAEADAWDDPECVGCHVTGIADKHHVADANLPPEVWNVQCEECHGIGFQHARDGSFLGAGESTCRRCHDAENSPEFDYELYSSYGVH